MSLIVIDGRELRTTSGRYVERLLNYLPALDKTNRYKVLLKPSDVASWKPAGPNFEAILCPHKEFTFAEQLGLKRQIEGLKPDLVHFPFPQQPVLYKSKVVTTIHDLTTLRFDNPDKPTLVFKIRQVAYGRVMKRVGHKSVRLLTGSEFVRQDYAKFAGIDPSKITVTYEAADPIRDKPEAFKGLEGKQFIMYVGRPTPHKNLERLVEAFAKLKAQHPQLFLVLAGKKDANYMRIESAALRRAIKGVVFTDHVSEGQLRWCGFSTKMYRLLQATKAR